MLSSSPVHCPCTANSAARTCYGPRNETQNAGFPLSGQFFKRTIVRGIAPKTIESRWHAYDEVRRMGNEGPQMMDENRAKTGATPRFPSPALTVTPLYRQATCLSNPSFQPAPACSPPSLKNRRNSLGEKSVRCRVESVGKVARCSPATARSAANLRWNGRCNEP